MNSSDEEESLTSDDSDIIGDSDNEASFDEEEVHLNTDVCTVASLIAVNQAYLDLIERIIKKVENILEVNREDQKKIRLCLNKKHLGGDRGQEISNRALYCAPYFKDRFNMVSIARIEELKVPPMNEDARKLRAISSVNFLMTAEKTWNSEELRILNDAVMEQVVSLRCQSILSRRNVLREKVANYRAEDGIEQLNSWREELENVERRLGFFREKNREDLMEMSNYDGVDWAKIAAVDFCGTRTITQLKMKWLNDVCPKWYSGPWTPSEDDIILSDGQSPWTNWDLVAEKLNTNRSPYACFERFQYVQRKARERKPWSVQEDEKLVSLVQTFRTDNEVNWNRVSAHMDSRSRWQCIARYTRSLDARLKHGRWTNTEDLLLVSAVNKYGPYDWVRIASLVSGRTAAQCRARWVDVLDFKNKSLPWNADEDETLLVGMEIFGNRTYAQIAKLLPGRNATAVKNRIRTFIRWKISTLLDGTSLRERYMERRGMDYFKKRSDDFFQRFGDLFYDPSNSSTQSSSVLSKRLGYGNFIFGEDGGNFDYSEVKEQVTRAFGDKKITAAGRWSSIIRNPNEYDVEELKQIKKSLPDESLKALNELEARIAHKCDADSNSDTERSQSERILQYFETVVTFSKNDLVYFNKNLRRPVKIKPISAQPKKNKRRIRISRRREAAANFSSLLSDLTPGRYTVKDRLTDEICHKINQLPIEERRAFILASVCDVVAQHCEADVRKVVLDIPREVTSLRTTEYITNAVFSTPKNDINNILSTLIPPGVATCNLLLHYKDSIRKDLVKGAALIFPTESSSQFDEREGLLDIRLSNEIKDSAPYLLLKQCLFRLCFLPMLMQRALETQAERQKRVLLRESLMVLRCNQSNLLAEEGILIQNRSRKDLEIRTYFSVNQIYGQTALKELVNKLNSLEKFTVYDPTVRLEFRPDVNKSKARRIRQPTQIKNVNTDQGPSTSVRGAINAFMQAKNDKTCGQTVGEVLMNALNSRQKEDR